MAEQYKTLNDAADQRGCAGLANGRTEIWYTKRNAFRKWSMGPTFAEEPLPVPTTTDLSRDHVLLGTIKETNLGEIFNMLQGEMWSPGGEANGLVRSKGTGHTSMSVGDIIVVGSRGWMVDGAGFVPLPRDARESEAQFQASQTKAQEMRVRFGQHESMRSLLRGLEEEAAQRAAFGWYKPQEVYQALVDAYLKVHSLKADFDRMEEIPAPMAAAYKAVGKAADAIMQAQKAASGLADEMRSAYRKVQG